MPESTISIFMPTMDGEYVPVTFKDRDSLLKADQVYIFCHEEERAIYIWTGSEAPVRAKFISSRIAQQIRLEKGLTHRISTEEQGNETKKFLDMVNLLDPSTVKVDTGLEVSPANVEQIPDSAPINKSTKKDKKKKAKKTKVSKRQVPAKASTSKPKPSQIATKTLSKKPRKEEVILKSSSELLSLDEYLYVSSEQKTAIDDSKAVLLHKSIDQNSLLTTLIASSAAANGRIALYCEDKTTKTTDCTNKKPILVIYLNSKDSTVIELDDLCIPIPSGNSIYYSCPEKTFLGLNLED